MKSKIVLLTFLVLTLVSCKEDVMEVFYHNQFNESQFENNYYVTKDQNLINNVVNQEEISLDGTKRFETYEDDPNFSDVDRHFDRDINNEESKYKYYVDDRPVLEVENRLGVLRRASNYVSSFKRGYPSKLYDGRMFCFARHQKVRVQINNDGFAHHFENELQLSRPNEQPMFLDSGAYNPEFNNEYLAINFKGASDHNVINPNVLGPQSAVIDLNLHLYFKSNDEYQKYEELSITFPNISMPFNGDGPSRYMFVGFYFNPEIISSLLPFTHRMVGLGITYSFVSVGNGYNDLETRNYALFLYEILLPTSRWY